LYEQIYLFVIHAGTLLMDVARETLMSHRTKKKNVTQKSALIMPAIKDSCVELNIFIFGGLVFKASCARHTGSNKMSKSKNLFSDPYEDVVASTMPVRANERQKESEFFDVPWTDQSTGAEYILKERAPKPPQGDFSMGPKQAEERYRMIMGLPAHQSFHERPIDNPFEEERLAVEPIVDQNEIETKIRNRARFDTQREQLTRPHAEGTTWASQSDFVDHGTHFEDPSGRILEKPKNTVGLYGTDAERGPFWPSKFTQETKPVEPERRPHTTGIQSRTTEESIDALQERLSRKTNVQLLLGEAYRGLFGSGIANHIAPKPTKSDARRGQDTLVAGPLVANNGLIRPWEPPTTKTDRPKKADAMAYEVGLRAIQTLTNRKMVPKVLELSKSDKDDLTLALGRTVLNALDVLPTQTSHERPDVSVGRDSTLEGTIAKALTPDILKALVPPEMLADLRPKLDKLSKRITNAGQKNLAMPQRNFDTERRTEKANEVTRPTVGQFTDFASKKRQKNVFESEFEGLEEGPTRTQMDSMAMDRTSKTPVASTRRELWDERWE